jgi:hypothetical protein
VDGPFGPHGPLGQGGLLTQPSTGMGPLGMGPFEMGLLGQGGLLTQPGAGIWRKKCKDLSCKQNAGILGFDRGKVIINQN